MQCISSKTNTSRLSKGFTLIEVLVIAPIVILAIMVFVGIIVTLTGDVLRTNGSNDFVNATQSALDAIEQDVAESSTTFLATSYTPASPQGITGTTNFDGSSPFTANATSPARLIIRSLTTTTSPLVSGKQLIYKTVPACTGSSAVPFTVDVVYYLNGSTLWRRVIDPSLNGANGAGTPCSTPWQAPSCSPGYVAAICKAEDNEIVNNIASVTVDYLNSTGVSVGSTPTVGAVAAKITLATTNTVAGRTDTYTAPSRTIIIPQ